MLANPDTELPEQLNKPRMGSILQTQQSGCPIAGEISHRLQLPPVISRYGSVDVGNVCLTRDDFCPESAHCVLCSFVAKVRPVGTNNASPRSVHFVIDDYTNDRLREWASETPPLYDWTTSNLTIVVTSGPNVFQRVHWHVHEPFEHPREHESESILGTIRLWKYQVPNCNLTAPKLDKLTYIAKQAEQWLRFCDGSHEVCKSLVSNSTPPISLIDCNLLCLVHGSEGIRYVALSYVWGKTGRNFNLPERKYGVPFDELPRTIDDAIAVTKSLGYDYLWVDMLCIDQQSKEDKQCQIAIMDQIYRSADLTIIVAAGNDCGDGIPGVSERYRPPRLSITIRNTKLIQEKQNAVNEIEDSIWRSRGWTFQEGLLSRRRLVFTDSQMLFACLSGQTIEPREGPEFSHKAWEADNPSAPTYMYRELDIWDSSFLQTDRSPRTTLIGNGGHRSASSYGFPIALAELLEKYSTLDFSFESDIVNAFGAIGNIFALRTPPVFHLYGLPFIFDDEPTTASSITRGLAWCLEKGNEESVRRPGFPSWSWLGYKGPVRWGALLRGGATLPIDRQWSAKTFSHVRSMITINNRRFELSQLSQWWREWSSAKASEGLAPSRLMILGSMIKQKVWSSAECTLKEAWGESTRYIITGKGPWFSDFQYAVGDSLVMSVDACQRLLKNLRRGSWRALLLTDEFLLIIQSVAADAKGGPYRRVASADINTFHRTKFHHLERDDFVKNCTDPVEIELV